jgi:membrane protease YdiL (CAAX protease family)
MTTLIGQRLRDFPEGLVMMTAVCCTVVLIEFSGFPAHRSTFRAQHELSLKLSTVNQAYEKGNARYEDALAAYQIYAKAYQRYLDAFQGSDECRVGLAVLVLAFYPILANGRFSSVGMIATPFGGWRYWCVAALVLTLVVAVLAIPAAGLWWLSGGRVDDIVSEEWHGGWWFHLRHFFLGPASEEIIYRMGICSIVAGWLGPRTAIAVSGVLFALVHLAYGGVNPVNLVAGFVLAWAFLKSNTILVPIALHGFGNILGWLIVTQLLIPLCQR